MWRAHCLNVPLYIHNYSPDIFLPSKRFPYHSSECFSYLKLKSYFFIFCTSFEIAILLIQRISYVCLRCGCMCVISMKCDAVMWNKNSIRRVQKEFVMYCMMHVLTFTFCIHVDLSVCRIFLAIIRIHGSVECKSFFPISESEHMSAISMRIPYSSRNFLTDRRKILS